MQPREMYDTVRFFYPCNGLHLFNTIGDLVELVACDPNGGEYVTGRLQNLRVTVKPYGVRIEGSLCKFYHGNNYRTLDTTSTREAIELLSDHFNLNIAASKIERLDIGANLQMQYEPAAYFDYLGLKSRYKRAYFPTSVLYFTKSKELCFYDKARETKDKGTEIPQEYAGKNLLRYEARIKKQPTKVLHLSSLVASDLWSKEIWNGCANYLQNQYNSIKKYGTDNDLKEFNLMSLEDLYNEGIRAYAREQGGVEVLLAAVKRRQQQGKLDKYKAKRFKDRIIKAAEGKVEEEENPCIIQELTQKVQKAVEAYKV